MDPGVKDGSHTVYGVQSEKGALATFYTMEKAKAFSKKSSIVSGNAFVPNKNAQVPPGGKALQHGTLPPESVVISLLSDDYFKEVSAKSGASVDSVKAEIQKMTSGLKAMQAAAKNAGFNVYSLGDALSTEIPRPKIK